MCLKLAYRHPASLWGLSTKAPTSVPSLCLIFSLSLSFFHSLTLHEHVCAFVFSSQFGELFSSLNYSRSWTSSRIQEECSVVFHCPRDRFNLPHHSRPSHWEYVQQLTTSSLPSSSPDTHRSPGSVSRKQRLGPEIKAILESKAAWLWKSIILFCHGNDSCQAARRRKVEFFTQMLCASLDVLRLTLRCFWSPSQSA